MGRKKKKIKATKGYKWETSKGTYKGHDETWDILKPKKSPKPSGKTLFKKPKHKKYAKMISFKNPTQARISARKLRKEFREAKQNAKQLRIARATQYASNRAKASSKRKKLSTNERKQIKEIGKIYDTTANSMWKKYKK